MQKSVTSRELDLVVFLSGSEDDDAFPQRTKGRLTAASEQDSEWQKSTVSQWILNLPLLRKNTFKYQPSQTLPPPPHPKTERLGSQCDWSSLLILCLKISVWFPAGVWSSLMRPNHSCGQRGGFGRCRKSSEPENNHGDMGDMAARPEICCERRVLTVTTGSATLWDYVELISMTLPHLYCSFWLFVSSTHTHTHTFELDTLRAKKKSLKSAVSVSEAAEKNEPPQAVWRAENVCSYKYTVCLFYKRGRLAYTSQWRVHFFARPPETLSSLFSLLLLLFFFHGGGRNCGGGLRAKSRHSLSWLLSRQVPTVWWSRVSLLLRSPSFRFPSPPPPTTTTNTTTAAKGEAGRGRRPPVDWGGIYNKPAFNHSWLFHMCCIQQAVDKVGHKLI